MKHRTGVDLREYSPEDLRRQIGFVPQETFLFSATLAENIAFGVEQAGEEEIRRAAELAGLAPDIAGFPARYIHPQEHAVRQAMERARAARGHNPGHSAQSDRGNPMPAMAR